MNERKYGETILSLLFLAFFAGYLAISMTYSPKARRMPLVVGIPGMALAVATVVKSIRRPLVKKEEAASPGEGREAEAATRTTEWKKEVGMIGWIIMLIGMIWILGFLVTIPLYTLLYMKSMKESWGLSILIAATGFVALYLIFVVGINLELYPGLLFQS